MESDLQLYRRRAHEERRAADRAVFAEARQTHLLLADTFDRKARELEATPSAREPRKRLTLKAAS